jgi:ABC-2 type transport system permease protein
MLMVTACLVGVLFVYGSPEWGSIISGYLGLLLTGAVFISVGLFISSLATSPWAAGLATFAISLALGASAWLARSGIPSARPVFQYFSAADAFDDFGKGVIDTGHLIACLSIIALGLFLTVQTLAPHQADGRADR